MRSAKCLSALCMSMLVLVSGCAGVAAPPAAPSLAEPRIAPLPEAQWTAAQRETLQRYRMPDGHFPNLLTTLANHPKLADSFTDFSNYIAAGTTLSARDRELLILRTGWLCGSRFELGWHVLRGRAAGLTDGEIARVAEGPRASGWSESDGVLLRAVDELHARAFVTDATWSALSQRYDRRQLMDLLFTVGQYKLLAMFLNSAGVQLDPGVPEFPAGR